MKPVTHDEAREAVTDIIRAGGVTHLCAVPNDILARYISQQEAAGDVTELRGALRKIYAKCDELHEAGGIRGFWVIGEMAAKALGLREGTVASRTPAAAAALEVPPGRCRHLCDFTNPDGSKCELFNWHPSGGLPGVDHVGVAPTAPSHEPPPAPRCGGTGVARWTETVPTTVSHAGTCPGCADCSAPPKRGEGRR